MKVGTFSLSIVLVFLIFFEIPLRAEVTLPAIFGDHMVLQQGTTLPVWGKASPGESVTVTIEGESAQTSASADGSWRVMLHPLLSTPHTKKLVVQGKNRIEIEDVAIGDVWLCAGEGNMEFPLSDAVGGKDPRGEIADQYLRFFVADKRALLTPDRQGGGHWIISTPESSAGFSAVGYFFARDLRNAIRRPIGMIQCTWSDSPVQAWISKEGLSAGPSFSHQLAEWNAESLKSADFNPVDQKTPSALFNGMIAPLIPYAMSGVICYQGESDEQSAALEYRRLFSRLITDWRAQWGEGPFLFLFVQSAGFGDEEGSVVEPFLGENHRLSRALPWLREGAACALSLPNTGMAVATDLGLPDEQQPPDKLDVARRLSLLARKRLYGEEIVDSGPLFESIEHEGAKIRVKFTHLGSGLTLGASPFQRDESGPALSTRLAGFALAGADGKWFPATGMITGDSVLLSSDAVPYPRGVRYNWKGFPNGNLYNREGLPAAPFRSDEDQPAALSP